MKTIALLLLCCLPAVGQKMHVKVISRDFSTDRYTRMAPGVALAQATTPSSATAVYLPPHTIERDFSEITLKLELPDGRKATVWCMDGRHHNCKIPFGEELEADFSGKKVKLVWLTGTDGKKKDSQEYEVLGVHIVILAPQSTP